MDIHLYNTLTSTKELFSPLKKGEVSLYHCGPTVYDHVHIGNLRTFVFDDIIRRVFEYNDYKVIQVMNITDVDDKTIRKSLEEGTTLEEFTRRYERLFFEDIAALNILTPHKLPRATDHIQTIIKLIQRLLEKKIAYETKDGIYFSIGLSKDYGKLAHLNVDNESRERIANDEYEKENPRDFALWKFHVPEDGDIAWNAPFGTGRPGWHIECSAMCMEELSETIDIHSGGTDLIFPHHVNEIAQSEAATGKQFVRYWLHGAFITVDDAKMAKSKNNFTKLADLREEHVSPLSYRYWLLTAHYRTQANFSLESVRSAQTALIRLINQFILLGSEDGTVVTSYQDKFQKLINDDFDMPRALALAWELIKDKNISHPDKRSTLLNFDRVFGFNLHEVVETISTEKNNEEVPAEILALVEAREEARKDKNWEMADAVRDEMLARGWNVIDTDKGPQILRA